MHFPMSPRWTSYGVPKPPKGAQKRKVSKIWTISSDNSETVRDRLLVTINHPIGSHIRPFDWYRPRWCWITLSGVIALILRVLPNSIALQANNVTVVEDRPIMSVKYCLPFLVFHFWLKLTQPAARSLCDSWASCSL